MVKASPPAADSGAEQDRNNSTEIELLMIKLELIKVVSVASSGGISPLLKQVTVYLTGSYPPGLNG